jgi:glycosyltransferase involved in cell wall biosynthesis
MTLLLERLKSRQDIELGVVAQCGLQDHHFKANGVEYFVVRTPWITGIRNRLGSYKEVLPVKSQIRKYAAIVNHWNPDIVHVHGTESGFGLIKVWGLIEKPVVVSIQGLMGPCAANAYGHLLPRQLHGPIRSAIGVDPTCLRIWKEFVERIPIEEEILRSADMVLGRTQWDHAWACAYRPDVCYRHVDELMRPEFCEAPYWTVEKCKRRQIFCTSASQPLKGLHVLAEAVYRLREVYPDIHLNVACNGFVPHPKNDYARFVLEMIKKWHLERAITFLGYLEAGSIVEQLRKANCFVTPSFIENGCNALQEAMLVGTPTVSTLTGGLLTTIDSERTGLTFPPGDAALLAWQIGRIFRDDRLASGLGANARSTAMEKHNPARVEEQLMAAYREAMTGISNSESRYAHP